MPRLDCDIFVDEFYPGGRIYFLSHFHADHMPSLSKGWNEATLICSHETAALLRAEKAIQQRIISPISPGESLSLKLPAGRARITAFDANHCPGALMFLFEFPNHRVLYTGDFRFNSNMLQHINLFKGVEILYLDTTFEDSRFVFPPREEAIAVVLEHIALNPGKEIFIALYTVGKNRIVSAIHNKFGKRVYVSPKIFMAYNALGQSHLVTLDKNSTNLRGYMRFYLERYFQRDNTREHGRWMVIIPTGWAVDYRNPPKGFYYIPYSEHCSSAELKEFVELVRPHSIIKI